MSGLYCKKIARGSIGQQQRIDAMRKAIRDSYALIAAFPDDEYRCDISRNNIRILKKRYRVEIADMQVRRVLRPELPGSREAA